MAEPKRRYIFSVNYLIFGNGRDLPRKSAFWNMMFSGINALQSAVMLLMVTRICGVEAGGVFAIANATAQLMYVVGTYSVRNFQATDIVCIYSYQSYTRTRIITGSCMVVASVAFCLLRGYGAAKMGVILMACTYKLVEVGEDLDHGELQRRGRLDVAGRVGTLRIVLNDILFFAVLATSHNMTAALAAVALTAFLVTAVCHQQYRELWSKEPVVNGQEMRRGARRLLWACFPLFASGCLAMYINNAAKYAIDAHLDDVAQTYFSVLFMPCFTINLLSGMVFRPQMKRMAELWNSREYEEYRKIVLRQVLVIVILSITITAGGVLVGVRLLGLMYGLELDAYKTQFAILLLGGGCSALYSYMDACITIMRKQKALLAVSGAATGLAFLISGPMVIRAGLNGACWIYLLLVLLEALGSVMFVTIFYYQAVKRGKGETNK